MTVSAQGENRLRQVINEQKQRDELNKRNAEILKQAKRREAERKKAEERIEAERIKQAEAQTKILENQAAATTTVATTEGGTQDAVQEQSTDEVVTQESTRRGEGVRERDEQPAVAETTGETGTQEQVAQEQAGPTERQETKAEQLKRRRQDRKEQVQESTDRARQDSVVTPPKPKPTRDPATVWASLCIAQSYDTLSPELQEQFQNDPAFTKVGEPNLGRLKGKYMSLAQADADAQNDALPNTEKLINAQFEIEGLQGETTSDVDRLTDAVEEMLEIAYGSDNPNPNVDRNDLNNKSERRFVTDFLLNTQFTDQQIDIIRQEFINIITTRDRIEMQTKDVESQWVTIAERLGAMDAILEQMGNRVRNRPTRYKATQEPTTGVIGATEQKATDLNEEKATQKLTDMIVGYLTEKKYITKTTNQDGTKISKIVEMENYFKSANKEAIVQGVPLKDYFDKDGNLNLVKTENANGMKVRKPAPVNNKQTAPTVNDIVNEADSKDGKFYRYDS